MMWIVLLLAGIALITFAFGLLGNLPTTPLWLEAFNSTIGDLLSNISYTLAWLLGAELYFSSIIIIGIIFAFEPVYHGVMWTLKKIPILGIK